MDKLVVLLCLVAIFVSLSPVRALPVTKKPIPAFEFADDDETDNRFDLMAVPAAIARKTTTPAPKFINRIEEADAPFVFTEEPEASDPKVVEQPDEEVTAANTIEADTTVTVETTTDFLDNRHVFDVPVNCMPGKKTDRNGICRKIQ
jgi:hypothetical protein